jgi:hypothetical protein
MVQFYFLSIFLNLAGGLSLLLGALPPRKGPAENLRSFLLDPTVSLVVGILASVTGALKLLTVYRGDIPVVGDFLPAVAGLAVGVTLILGYFRGGSGREAPRDAAPAGAGDGTASGMAGGAGRPSRVEALLLDNRMAVGIVGILAAAVHFLFPMVLFL